ncbi:MAG: heavy-metal-associated domain-containing protein [Vicingaceae bacterium]
MNELSLEIENLKCNGCGITISNAILKLNGVHEVDIDHENSIVNIVFVGSEEMKKKVIEKKLAQLGYPIKGTGNTIHKAKSYVSCAIGKMTEKTER